MINDSKRLKGRVWNIMIVDDHPLLRHGLKQLLEDNDNLRVTDEANTISEALDMDNRSAHDLIITDLSLAGGNGLDLMKRLRARNSGLRILVCSMHDEALFAYRALSAGAMGYISKAEATLNIVDAVYCVLQGKIWISETMSRLMAQKQLNTLHNTDIEGGVTRLTNRELEIFELIGNGEGTSHIASVLHLSVKTIETHRENIKRKLILTSGNALTRRAMQWVLENR